MVDTGLVSESATPLVWMLRCPSATCKPKAQLLKNRNRFRRDGIAWIGKADRSWDAILGASRVDGLDLLTQLTKCSNADAQMITRVITDLESVLVQFFDLFPRHVVLLVRAKGESFSDEERRAEAVPF